MLSNPGHLLPDKLSDFVKCREHALVAFRVANSRRQPQIFSQLCVRRSDVFVAALAVQPTIESTSYHSPLFGRRFRGEGAAQIVQIRDFKLVRLVIAAEGCQELLVTKQFPQSLEQERAFAGNYR